LAHCPFRRFFLNPKGVAPEDGRDGMGEGIRALFFFFGIRLSSRCTYIGRRSTILCVPFQLMVPALAFFSPPTGIAPFHPSVNQGHFRSAQPFSGLRPFPSPSGNFVLFGGCKRVFLPLTRECWSVRSIEVLALQETSFQRHRPNLPLRWDIYLHLVGLFFSKLK